MACRYTYQGKTYEAHEFDDVLRSMPPSTAAAFMPSIKSVPEAPFVQDTKSWVALAMKRALVMAAQGGYEKVAFIDGAQAADLYSLRKQLSAIEYEPAGDGKWEIVAMDLKGKRVLEEDEATAERLEELVGKDMANKIIAGEGELKAPGGWAVFVDGQKAYENKSENLVREYARVADGDVDVRRVSDGYRDWRRIEGEGLEVGGEGMKVFYDQIVPQVARDLAKKLGGKAGSLRFGSAIYSAKEAWDGGWLVTKNGVSTNVGEKLDRDEAISRAKSLNEEAGSSTQLAIDVTPEMREKLESGAAMFSRSRDDTWDSPSASKWDDAVYKMQDKNVDLKRVIEALQAAGHDIADDLNTYLQEELYHGRAAKRTEDFINQELNPLTEEMAKHGLTIEQVDEFLHARHAKEANAVVAQRNPDEQGLQDGGSGMTNAAADAYMAGLSPAQRANLEAAAARVDAIIGQTRDMIVGDQLESRETVDGWTGMFKHYVPLMREEKDGGGAMGIGQGFSIKGRETKSRTGSTRKVVDILANIAIQREKAIVRGEKNRVARSLVGLATANPNPGFWAVNDVPAERKFNPATGRVELVADTMFKQRDNVLVAKIADPSGEVREHAVVFDEGDPRAVRMAASLKNLDAAQLEGLMGASAKVTRYFASINTAYNPVFGIVNLVRDIQGAALNLSSTPLKNKKAEVVRNILPALKGIYSDMRKVRNGEKAGSEWAELWEDFQNAGGQTGYRDQFRNSADRAEAIQRALDPTAWMDSKLGKVFTAGGALKAPLAQAQKAAGGLFNWLEDYNGAMENGTRLAAYKVALDSGMSREQAASLAKNMTTNFNRKGNVAQQVGALYAFFNAAMQGTARIAQTIFTMEPGKPKTIRLSPTGKKIVYGGMLLGAVQALALAAAGLGEDDPPEFARERSIIIPYGALFGSKQYLSIPMPLGFHVLPNLGRIPVEFALSGFKDPAANAIKMMALFADAFNPIGNAGLSMQTLSPTTLDPLVALTENRDWAGKPIAKESMNRAVPGHALARDTATSWSRMISEGINALTGGNEHVAGVLSPSPDAVDYLLGQLTGGVGREISKSEQTGVALIRGEAIPTYKIPLVGRFIGNAAGQASESSAFYANSERLNRIETEIKGLRADGKTQEADALRRAHPEALLIAQANTIERTVSKLRKQKSALLESDAPRQQIVDIEARITAEMARLNRAMEKRTATQ